MKHTRVILFLILMTIIIGSIGYFGFSFFSHPENSSHNNTTGSTLSTGTTDDTIWENTVVIPRVYTGILYNPIWQSSTQSGMYYALRVDNQRELSKEDIELLQKLKDCGIDKTIKTRCKGFPDNTTYIDFESARNKQSSTITPQIEKLVNSFFRNPILLQSSQSCAKYFWESSKDGVLYYPNEDMGEPPGWWNPYMIDINEFMKINPESHQKEIEPSILWTFNTQIQFAPLKPDQKSHYPNMLLIECLKKNKLLIPLQKHVGSHYEKIETALHGN